MEGCTSANEEFARGNERSYVAALEAAAERLQRKLDATKASNALAPMGLPPTAQPRGKSRKISGTQRKEASDVNELVSDFGFLTVNATSRDFHGFTSTMSFAKLLLAMAVKTDLPATATAKLPPRYAVMQALEGYFGRTFVLLPFFSETDFMTSLSRVYQDAISSPVTPLDFWYVRLVLAISYATSSRTKGDDNAQLATQHMAAAMQLAEYVIRPGSIAGVQALLLLVEYALLDPTSLDAWYLIGMASRLVVDLGLHCEPSAETRIPQEELNMRRRVFHATYALDRLFSISTARAFSFTDDSASGVPLPDTGSEQQTSAASGLFLHSIKPSLYLFDIRRVQSAFYQTTRYSSRSRWSITQASSYVTSTSNDVRAWYSSIPSSLSQTHLTFFNLERLYTHILVLGPHPRHPMSDLSELDKAMIFEYCTQYAELLHPVTNNIDHHPFFCYTDICRTRWVGKQFLDVMWSDFDCMIKAQHVIAGNMSSSLSVHDNCARALGCIRQISDILNVAGTKLQMTEFKDQYEKESAVLVARLSNRQQETSTAGPSGADGTFMPSINPNYPPYIYTDATQYPLMPEDAGQRISPGSRRVYSFIGGSQQ